MRFLIAIVVTLLLMVLVNGDHHLSKPHHPGYHGVKKAFGALERQLDALSYVLAVKGAPAKRVCGLDVPTVGRRAREDIKYSAPIPKPQPQQYNNNNKADSAKKPAAYSAPNIEPVKEDVKLAVVKYADKKKLDDALKLAGAEIAADQAVVAAKKAEITYLKAEEAIVPGAKVQDIVKEIVKQQAEIKVIEKKEEALKVAEEAIKQVNSPKVAYANGAGFKTEQTKKGVVLADKKGNALYTNDDEADGQPKCVGECAAFWIPVPPGDHGAEAGVFGSCKRPDGSLQATLNGRPLYRFISDQKAGDVNGDNVGKWRVVSNKAKSATKKAKSASKKATAGYAAPKAKSATKKAKSASKKVAAPKAKSASKKATAPKAKSATKKAKSASKKATAGYAAPKAKSATKKAKSASKKVAAPKAKSATKKAKSASAPKAKSASVKAAGAVCAVNKADCKNRALKACGPKTTSTGNTCRRVFQTLCEGDKTFGDADSCVRECCDSLPGDKHHSQAEHQSHCRKGDKGSGGLGALCGERVCAAAPKSASIKAKSASKKATGYAAPKAKSASNKAKAASVKAKSASKKAKSASAKRAPETKAKSASKKAKSASNKATTGYTAPKAKSATVKAKSATQKAKSPSPKRAPETKAKSASAKAATPKKATGGNAY